MCKHNTHKPSHAILYRQSPHNIAPESDPELLLGLLLGKTAHGFDQLRNGVAT